MTSIRLILFVGSIALLAAAPGCGASAGSPAKAAPAPAAAPVEQEHEMSAYSADYASGAEDEEGEDEGDWEGAAEKESLEEPSSMVEIAGEDETIALDSLADADALLTRSVELIDELLGTGKKRARSSAAPARLSAGSSGCASACKAFSSLERAADAVCRLAGEDTRRCKKAREIVAENERRVAVCDCVDE